MKKIITLALLFTVTYNLNFKPYHGGKYEQKQITKSAKDSRELVDLIKKSPEQNKTFECVDKETGRKGKCFISELTVIQVGNSL